MVCLGNICRSPMAEGVLRSVAEEQGLDVEIDSAGTGNYHVGETPDPRAIETMKINRLDISGLRARQLVPADLEYFDRIFVMDLSNLRNTLRLAQNETQRNKVSLLMDEVFPGRDVEVPDPWFGGPQGFHEVYSMLCEACKKIVDDTMAAQSYTSDP